MVMPPLVFLLMALEAARQLQSAAEADACFVHLSDILFEDPMPLELVGIMDSTTEMHLHARQTTDIHHYQFEILSITSDDPSSSARHCSGKFHWSSSLKNPNLTHPKIMHDPSLLQQSKILGRNLFSRLKVLEIGPEGSTGEFDGPADHQEHYCLDPLTLNSILQLPTASLLGRSLPARHRISSIGSVVIPVGAHDSTVGRFAIEVQPNSTHGGQSTIGMNLDHSALTFADVHFEVDHLIEQAPALKSLFFKPVMLPDISTLAASETISLSTCLELLTYKWPMSDIGIAVKSGEDAKTVSRILLGAGPAERPRCRSIQILGKVVEPSPERVRVVDDFDVCGKFHMLFVDESLCLEQIKDHLLPTGLLCVRGIPGSSLSGSFTKACQVTGFEKDEGTLWHHSTISTERQPETYGNAVIFACPDQPIPSIQSMPAAQCVPLQRERVREFCRKNKGERFDAVVMDCVDKSIITTWAGADLVMWLQELMTSANSIIWVTQQASQNPYTNVAGTLLRTLQSEQPSLKVTWLSFESTEEGAVVQASIASASTDCSQEANEVRIQVKDSQRHLIRYQPDDGLAASTGLILSKTDRFDRR